MKMTRKFNVYMNFVILVTLFYIHIICPQAQGQIRNHDREIAKYVQFLQAQDQSSVDYVLNLFQQNDLVILCERAHLEMTQYDLILNILSDKRFTDRVGHLFTEAGTISMQPYVESFLVDATLDEKGTEEHARHICRNLTWYPHREVTSYYELLKKVHQLNRNLSTNKRIHMYPSDLPFSWDDMTAVKYQEFRKALQERDKIMADQIADQFDAIRKSSDPRQKALVIMNYRHAFPHLEISRGGRTKKFANVGGFLMARYPRRVANVMINSIRLLPGSGDNNAVFTALQDGKWDAACSVLGNPDIGFDFVNSPFGEDSFDYFPIISRYRYQDVFTGFIFYKPLGEHKMSMGIPNVIEDAFVGELTRRYQIAGELQSAKDIAEKIQTHRTIRTFGYENKELFGESDYKDNIQKWLKHAN